MDRIGACIRTRIIPMRRFRPVGWEYAVTKIASAWAFLSFVRNHINRCKQLIALRAFASRSLVRRRSFADSSWPIEGPSVAMASKPAAGATSPGKKSLNLNPLVIEDQIKKELLCQRKCVNEAMIK